MGFWLLFSGIITIIKGINVSLNIISDCSRCIRVFELLIYLGTGACIIILFRALHTHNLLLLRLPFCLIAAAVYRVSIEFPFLVIAKFLREERWI